MFIEHLQGVIHHFFNLDPNLPCGYYYPHFTNKETETQREYLGKAIHLGSGGAGTQPHVCPTPATALKYPVRGSQTPIRTWAG